jgi:hypothetical protein
MQVKERQPPLLLLLHPLLPVQALELALPPPRAPHPLCC